MANTEHYEYPADVWRILILSMYDSRSTLASADIATEQLRLLDETNLEHPQVKVLKLISSCNDLDVIHRTCANELGLTEKVAELDAWIANKARRKAENGG
jgi:hypothetical protein